MIVFGTVLAISAALLIVLVVVLMAYVPRYTLTPADVTLLPGETPSATRSPSTPTTVSSPADFLRLLVVFSSLAFFVVLVIGALLMRMVVNRALAPLADIDAAARDAVAGDLSSRVTVDGPPDEVTSLARSFNAMLARLQRSFDSQRQFAANASHELQTPLATSKAVIDVALGDPDLDHVHGLLTDLRELSTRSTQTVTALLDLAAAQDGDLDRQTIAVDTMVQEVLNEHRSQAAVAEVELRLARTSPASVDADSVLLRLMLHNLVSNAIQHNTRPGVVDASLTVDAGQAVLSIINSGPVLSPQQAARVTQPFYRAHGRTVSATGRTGRGLGAALVAHIAERHSWPLDVTARPAGGLLVRVRMPCEPTPENELSHHRHTVIP
ncbi:sensor histidine kinase [Streptomyces pakalii]|uniref:histidine kinase n=1 Tax=Streptomyces pakalii TaxID=3036494 RepID=A0ABT7DD01_9ACTN|nr:HAMP domain-containing sensor histidine kinase [Streptomyces pakalii]MDJ1642739.1 HAMP domain-containing sensor histidine kinase [Streptomyces pakalii]